MVCPSCTATNPPGMRFCGMCGRPLRGSGSERERRRVSVLFVDLTGFSTLTQGLDPEDLRDLADHVLTEVAGVIERFDGYVDAFRGDGLIAVFGAPTSHPDDPYRAVISAEASLHAIARVGRERGIPLSGRAGVTTGMVIAGAVGSGRVREYTVMGSSVNLASRLENAAGPGEVWVGDETYQATRHRLAFELVEGIHLPGFPNVRSAHRLLPRPRRDVDPYAHLPFVGRQRELARLEQWHRTVRRRGRPQVVWLLGDAGSGKSRLLREFALRLGAAADPAATDAAAADPIPPAGRNGTRVVWVHHDPHDGFSWAAVARQVFGLRDGEDDVARSERVQRGLQRLIPDEPRWHRLVLATLSAERGRSWRRRERRAVDRRLLAWRDVFAALAQYGQERGSLVVVVENDRFDPMLDAFVGQLAEAEAPILVVRASHGHELPSDAVTVAMEPLSLEESMTLFREVADPVFERAGRALVEQVGGVPTSVFELGHALSITQDTHFRGSLTSLLQARLDVLEPHARRLLALAALCGEQTWEGLLRTAQGDVRHSLRSLRALNVLVRHGTSVIEGEVEYRFGSELLRHAVLEMTPFGDRPELHLRIAAWLEQRAPLSLSELIAHHFEQGGAEDAAYGHYLAAADEAEADGDRGLADRLFGRLAGLDVPHDLCAQGALAYAQAAIARNDRALALAELDRARATLERCEHESFPQLRATEARLRADVLLSAERDALAPKAPAALASGPAAGSPTGAR